MTLLRSTCALCMGVAMMSCQSGRATPAAAPVQPKTTTQPAEPLPQPQPETAATEPAGEPAPQANEYMATLQPLNSDVTGTKPNGEVRLKVDGDQLTITVTTKDVPPGMMHLQHAHGFEDGKQAQCPTMQADANGDGVVDLIETRTESGVTMIPFHADPLSLEIKAESYPKAGDDGNYRYEQTVSLAALRDAYRKKFGRELELDKMTVFVHGVDPSKSLPASAQSLGDVPAHVTLPIACAEVKVSSATGSAARVSGP